MSFKDWDSNDKIQFLGQRLLERGFKDWFLFFFKTIEKTNFFIEPIHEDLFNCFNDVYNLKTTRQVINIPPRAGKTTLAIYFIAYCFPHYAIIDFSNAQAITPNSHFEVKHYPEPVIYRVQSSK